MTIFELIDDGDTEGIRELLAREPRGRATSRGSFMRACYRGGGGPLEAIRSADPRDPWDGS
jgi:hypothetical protein